MMQLLAVEESDEEPDDGELVNKGLICNTDLQVITMHLKLSLTWE
jgi:hypothetical protein